ncbi:hypothetical protein [Actinacidiphila sp. bgisy167]|uniref:hypothetical protein n=1 Tax=Actinacidiphila sp. bgisy167 TaxID=3413797 RepID=UPI003D7572F7
MDGEYCNFFQCRQRWHASVGGAVQSRLMDGGALQGPERRRRSVPEARNVPSGDEGIGALLDQCRFQDVGVCAFLDEAAGLELGWLGDELLAHRETETQGLDGLGVGEYEAGGVGGSQRFGQ